MRGKSRKYASFPNRPVQMFKAGEEEEEERKTNISVVKKASLLGG